MSGYHIIEKAIKYIEEHAAEQPELDEIAEHVSLSPYHFQKMFKDWAGISPKRFLQSLTINHAKKLLNDSRPILETAFDTGLSGASRLHDLFVSVDAVTPGEYKSCGSGLNIVYGFAETPFGRCLTASTPRGICRLAFLHGTDEETETQMLRNEWQNAQIGRDDKLANDIVLKIFHQRDERLNILMKGTNFQIKVWSAVLNLPYGVFAGYGDIARLIGMPNASRAVGTALGRNSIGYLIPCHRVLRETGAVTGYRWGAERKKAMIAYESPKEND